MAHSRSGKPYVFAWLALLALTATSYATSRLDLGSFGPVVALGIAFIKGSVVLAVFMHLARAPFVLRFIAVLNLAWVALLCAGIVLDVAAR